ncbi:MAG: chromate efflux transporter [Cytophagales bacterium]
MYKIRFLIFLRDVLYLSLTAVGGPNAHLATMLTLLINKRKYLSEDDFFELQALCQMLPGPTSTQTIVAVGYKIGGAKLAYLTLLVWCLPAVTIMTAAAFLVKYLPDSASYTVFVIPVAVGLVAYSSYAIASKVITSYTGVAMMVTVAIFNYFFRSPWFNPILIIIGGFITSLNYKKFPLTEKKPFQIEWSNFILFIGVFIFTLILGGISGWKVIKVFQNFYRTGSLIFGGGQVLLPLLHTEFVELPSKSCMTNDQFLAGYAFSQMVPGPVFSFCSYIGVFALKDNPIYLQILGGFVAAAGIFLPGTFLIFFIVRFWNQLKTYRPVKASLEGILAVSSGLVLSSAIVFLFSIDLKFSNICLIIATLILMYSQRVSPGVLVLFAFIASAFFK